MTLPFSSPVESDGTVSGSPSSLTSTPSFYRSVSTFPASSLHSSPPHSNPTAVVSDEELAVNEIESRVNSARLELATLESDVEQICGSIVLRDAYATTKDRFQRFELELRQSAVVHAKNASMSTDTIEAERAVFATRLRFLKLFLEGCAKYKGALLQMLNHPAGETFKAKRRTLTSKGKQILSKWFDEHRSNPFPTAAEKEGLARQVDAPVEQISTWFINARARRGKKQSGNETQRKRQKRMKKSDDDESDDSDDESFEDICRVYHK